jgi:KaiC/GvpD/RAD55 family RecA-like ATPase
MDEITPPEAKSVSAGVRPIPFGMPTLDSTLGGLPSGTTTLLAGAPDAGIDAFTYTHLAQLMLAKHDPGLYPVDVSRYQDALPEKIVYISIGTHGRRVIHAMDAVLDQYQFDTTIEHLELFDYTRSFLDLLPIPAAFDKQRDKRGPLATVERKAPEAESFVDLLEAIAADIDDHAEDAVVVVDSLSDLYRARRFGLKEDALLAFLIGLRESASDWNGLVHVLYDRRAEAVRAEQVISSLMHGNIYFYSNDQGFETYRTMRVGSFGGALDREEQVVYRTLVGSAGFQVKSTKKISPGNW